MCFQNLQRTIEKDIHIICKEFTSVFKNIPCIPEKMSIKIFLKEMFMAYFLKKCSLHICKETYARKRKNIVEEEEKDKKNGWKRCPKEEDSMRKQKQNHSLDNSIYTRI